MRITNSMTRSNILWNINKNQERLDILNTQFATTKKIQKPSDDPIIAVRALKFRTYLREVTQYKTSAEDAKSWLSITEQAANNSEEQLKDAKVICIDGASDIKNTDDRQILVENLQHIKNQLCVEGNVSYAGRYVFSGFKTDTPLTYLEDTTADYTITENFKDTDITTTKKIIDVAGNPEIRDVHRIRLGYGDISYANSTLVPPFTMTSMKSTNANAYQPGVDEIQFIEDTGELIFNADNVNGVGGALPIPAAFDMQYDKTSFKKYDCVPELYFDCIDNNIPQTFTKPDDSMEYQISYNIEMGINTMGNQFFTNELLRDLEEAIHYVQNINEDGSLEGTLEADLAGHVFSKLTGQIEKHANSVIREHSVMGSKVNRLELTINRLEEDYLNFEELMHKNEGAELERVVTELKAQQTVYDASLMASSNLMQHSLLDFLR